MRSQTGSSRSNPRNDRRSGATCPSAARAGRARPRRGPGGRIKRASDFLKLDLDTRVRLLEEMTPLECAQLFHDWTFWARPDQAPPDGDWIIWLILAGRGAGKTRAGAEAVRPWIDAYPIVNLIGADPRRRPRHHGEGRIRHSRLLPARRAPRFPPPIFGSNGRTAR